MNRIVRDRRIRAGIVLLAMPALACTSSSQLDDIRTQLNEIHFELLELRKQGPSKAELEAVKAALAREIEALRKGQATGTSRLETLAERLRQLESKLDETEFSFRELGQKVEAATQELQALRSATEVARIPPAPPPPARPRDPADPQALYANAYNDYSRGAYDLAILGFRQYLESYSETDLADNAVYWLGECYFLQGKYQKAIEQFDDVVTRYERSDRNPSALLKKGFAHLELGQRAEGVVQLQNVICEYAGTDEARLAGQRLQTLGIDLDCEGP